MGEGFAIRSSEQESVVLELVGDKDAASRAERRLAVLAFDSTA
jgi:hypothetical protein